MNYSLKATASLKDEGTVEVGGNNIRFGVSTQNSLPSPADLLLAAFAACCLKNIERFSEFMHYNYESADISIKASRKDKPPMIDKIIFTISLRSDDLNINTDLLLRNLQKFGTIYNTLIAVCQLEGEILIKAQ